MRKLLSSLVFGTIFSVGLTLAAPVQQEQSAAPQSDNSGSNQTPSHKRVDPNRQLQMLSKRLNLTADQQNQILPILTDRQQQVQSILNDSSLSKKDRHEKLRAVREDSEAKIKAVLNDVQKQQYDQMELQMRERVQQRREQQPNS
jgi:periplasmic protein CpxP/Spy